MIFSGKLAELKQGTAQSRKAICIDTKIKKRTFRLKNFPKDRKVNQKNHQTSGQSDEWKKLI